MSFVFSLRSYEFDSVWSSLSSFLEKDSSLCLSLSLSVSLSLCWWLTGGHIRVLVWFRLGILFLILISVLCGIPDRLSSSCFWAHP
jgi:hypothetical protein